MCDIVLYWQVRIDDKITSVKICVDMRLINSFSLIFFLSLSFPRSNSEQDFCHLTSKITNRGEIIIGNLTEVMRSINTNVNIIWWQCENDELTSSYCQILIHSVMLSKDLSTSWLLHSALKFCIIRSSTSPPDCCTRQLIAAGGEALWSATLSFWYFR